MKNICQWVGRVRKPRAVKARLAAPLKCLLCCEWNRRSPCLPILQAYNPGKGWESELGRECAVQGHPVIWGDTFGGLCGRYGSREGETEFSKTKVCSA